MSMTIKIIISIVLALFAIFAIVQTCHYNKAARVHPTERKWGKYAIVWLFLIFVPFLIALAVWYSTIKDAVGSGKPDEPPEESVSGNELPVETEETVSENGLPEETASEETEPPKEEAELPPEQGEDVYDDEYADQLVGWEKTANDDSRVYLPTRGANMTDEEYKGALLTWLQSEELDEEFIPKDLTEEEIGRAHV